MNGKHDNTDERLYSINDNTILSERMFPSFERLTTQPRQSSSDIPFYKLGNEGKVSKDKDFRRTLPTSNGLRRLSSKDVIDILAEQSFTKPKRIPKVMKDSPKDLIKSMNDSPGLLLQKKSRCSYSYSLSRFEQLLPISLDGPVDIENNSNQTNCNDRRNVRFEVEPTTGDIVTHEIELDMDLDSTEATSVDVFEHVDLMEEKVDLFPKFITTPSSSVSTASSASSRRRGRKRITKNELVDAKPLSTPQYEAKKLQQFYDRRENRRAWRTAKKAAGSFLSEDEDHLRLANELHMQWEDESKSDSEDSNNINKFYTQWAESDGRGLEHPIFITSSGSSVVSAISDNDGDYEMNTERSIFVPIAKTEFQTSDISVNDDDPLLTTTTPRGRPKLITAEMAHKLAAADAIVAKSYCTNS